MTAREFRHRQKSHGPLAHPMLRPWPDLRRSIFVYPLPFELALYITVTPHICQAQENLDRWTHFWGPPKRAYLVNCSTLMLVQTIHWHGQQAEPWFFNHQIQNYFHEASYQSIFFHIAASDYCYLTIYPLCLQVNQDCKSCKAYPTSNTSKETNTKRGNSYNN